MPRTYRRPAHRDVLSVLSRLDRAFLAAAGCYFAGGTRIVLELGEYRESRDIDFLCASRDGYRRLRETVSERSLGKVASAVELAREVRADQYGIRTFLAIGTTKLKFEVIREARIDLRGEAVVGLPVECLARADAFAEKFLANADRGLDASTLSRDAVDLAFMVQGWAPADALAGWEIARSAYGASVAKSLAAVVARLREDRPFRARCIEALSVSDSKTLASGLELLATDKWLARAGVRAARKAPRR